MSVDSITPTAAERVVLAATQLEGTTVGRTDDGAVVVKRPLYDEQPTSMEDVVEIGTEHGLGIVDVGAHPDDGMLAVVFDGGDG